MLLALINLLQQLLLLRCERARFLKHEGVRAGWDLDMLSTHI